MNKSKFKWLLSVAFLLLIKGIILVQVAVLNDGKGVSITKKDYPLLLPHLALILIFLLPSLFFKNKGFKKYLLGFDFVYSILLIINLWIYRGTGYFYSLKYTLNSHLFNTEGNSLFNPSIIDLIFIIDVIILLVIYLKGKKDSEIQGRSPKLGFILMLICIITVFGCHYIYDNVKIYKGQIRFLTEEWQGSWSPTIKIVHRSPIGDQLYEGYKALSRLRIKDNEEEAAKAEEWLAWNKENLQNNEYYSIAKGKNIVFLQIESLENFVINEEAYGQEITPILNKLVKEGLYFNKVHEQNNAGNSIDCDMMVNTGILPLGGDTITFLSNPEVIYENSLPRVLSRYGYTSVSTHAERSGDWGWQETHIGGLGFQGTWDVLDYDIDEVIGHGLSDESFYRQYAKKLSTLKEPFYSSIPTLTSHGAYDIDYKYRELDFPKDFDSTILGSYFQAVHYADKQIGLFIDLLKENGLMDNTILVIYGDHGGIHKYYQDSLEDLSVEDNSWKDYTREIPLIMYGESLPNATIEKNGGQIDIMPTVLYLLGIDNDYDIIGRNLLNTNRDGTVLKGGEVIGNPTDSERKRLEEAYAVSEYLIKHGN